MVIYTILNYVKMELFLDGSD